MAQGHRQSEAGSCALWEKRGVFLGTIESVHRNGFSLESDQPVKAGDGIVVDRETPAKRRWVAVFTK